MGGDTTEVGLAAVPRDTRARLDMSTYAVVQEGSSFGIQLDGRIVIHEIDAKTARDVAAELNSELDSPRCEHAERLSLPALRGLLFSILAWVLLTGFIFLAVKAPRFLKVAPAEEVMERRAA